MTWSESTGCGGEYRFGKVEDIRIEEGYIDLDRGYFCLIERDGLCVEDFGMTRRQALRRARRAWRKEKDAAFDRRASRYPRVQDCV